ncbi:MAG: transcriptional repressor LexA [Bdellovibrionaceae bacterium]|nr:transcriptional repressor LexA [Pseudobdellovibrionaceae bacterium]MDW8189877.1 transcriptional repressor LexA [Pseudobdellovibrionaceae bacterium]
MNTPFSSNLIPLTTKEKAIFDFIVDYVWRTGTSPSYQEIQEYFGYRSINSVQNFIKQLCRKGYLKTTPHHKRGIQLTTQGTQWARAYGGVSRLSKEEAEQEVQEEGITIPILGRVAAGKGIEAFIHHETIIFPRVWFTRGNWSSFPSVFAVKVLGNSMEEEGILEGDTLLIVKTNRVSSGEMALVEIRDEGYTVKRIFLHPNQQRIELRPSNSQLQSRFFPEEMLRIEGRILGVLRSYDQKLFAPT